ncbi:cytochrome P450 [Mycena olivaceomarginata]|nr:cytochrome P450 [Mycena olivaceomarginata]
MFLALLPLVASLLYVVYKLVAVYLSPLHNLPSPPVTTWFGNHVEYLTNALAEWSDFAVWVFLFGFGLLPTEGVVHKRQRHIILLAFGAPNMRSLVKISFKKGVELKNALMDVLPMSCEEKTIPTAKIDVLRWLGRATFDVIGLAGFDYSFNSLTDKSNELFVAYKDMFEVAISQGPIYRILLWIYLPFVNRIFPDDTVWTIQRCQDIIYRVAGRLIQVKKKKVAEGEKHDPDEVQDLLTLLLRSNQAGDLPPEDRISDREILDNINTFMFTRSDTSPVSIMWTLLLLAQNPDIQDRLQAELLSFGSRFEEFSDLSGDQIQSFHASLSSLPLLHNVMRESLRLIPPIHSTMQVAMQDDEIPTMYPVHTLDGRKTTTILIPKSTFVHVLIEAFNLDKSVWGEDAWEFNPDRWDNLPEPVPSHALNSLNVLTFLGGPRVCPGQHFAIVEMKILYYILLTNFVFRETEEKIVKQNVHASASLWCDKEDCSYVKQIPTWIALHVFSQVCSADVPLFWLPQGPLFFAMSEFNSSAEGAFG